MEKRIKFNESTKSGKEIEYMAEAINQDTLSGGGEFNKKCRSLIAKQLNVRMDSILLTGSCTQSLEICSHLLDIKEGDEIIIPSYTFVSSALPFVVRGAKIRFADIMCSDLNINSFDIEKLVNEKTKAIVVVHYAGRPCNMSEITEIGEKYNIPIIEDAAQAYGSKIKGHKVGSRGDLVAFSFHSTKNITSGGEGGALIVNNPSFIDRALIIQEKGTDRTRFIQGHVDKYTWMDVGGSFLMSEVNAAYLLAQLEAESQITNNRVELWDKYLDNLSNIVGLQVPLAYGDTNQGNGHIFYVLTESARIRHMLKSHLAQHCIEATLHYQPLHSSPYGIKSSADFRVLPITDRAAECILRLPIHNNILKSDVDYISSIIKEFYGLQ